MKTRIISAVTLAVLAATSVSPALAVDASTSSSVRPVPSVRKEIKEQREQVKTEIKEKREQVKAETKERLSAARKEAIKRWWANQARRMKKLIDRETKMAEKLQERITRLAAAGNDMSKATADLAIARQAIADANTALTNATAQVESIIANNTPKEAFAKLHDLTKGVMEAIRKAHKALIAVLLDMKGMRTDRPKTKVSPTATPTPTPTATQ